MIFQNHTRQPLFFVQATKKVTNSTEKQHTKSEGQVLPLKKCTVFSFLYVMQHPEQTGGSPTGLFVFYGAASKCYMPYLLPLYHNIGVPPRQKAAEVHVFLDRGKHTLRLDGTVDPEQDSFVCGNLFLHCLTLLDEVF